MQLQQTACLWSCACSAATGAWVFDGPVLCHFHSSLHLRLFVQPECTSRTLQRTCGDRGCCDLVCMSERVVVSVLSASCRIAGHYSRLVCEDLLGCLAGQCAQHVDCLLVCCCTYVELALHLCECSCAAVTAASAGNWPESELGQYVCGCIARRERGAFKHAEQQPMRELRSGLVDVISKQVSTHQTFQHTSQDLKSAKLPMPASPAARQLHCTLKE